MKKASLMLAAVAGIGLMLAGCDMSVRDKVTFDQGVVSKAASAIDSSVTCYTMDYATSLPATIGTVGGLSCIDIASCGVEGTQAALKSAPARWTNPFAGNTAIETDGVTIVFDAYGKAANTFSGLLGIYDTDNTTPGFLWVTGANVKLNTSGNGSSYKGTFGYIDDCAIGLTDDTWATYAIVISTSSIKVYRAGSLVTTLSSTANGASMSCVLEFLAEYADTVCVGSGVAFWTSAGVAGTGVKNFKMYDKALTASQLGNSEIFNMSVTEYATYEQLAAAVATGKATQAELDALIAKLAANGYLNTTSAKTDESSLSYSSLATMLTTTIGGKSDAIDAYTYQATTNAPDTSTAAVKWSNPLKGKTLASGVTFSVDVYSASDATGINGYDTLIGFLESGTAWTYLGIYEGGAVHGNSVGGSYFDYLPTSLQTLGAWHNVSLVFNTDNSVVIYWDGTAVKTYAAGTFGNGTGAIDYATYFGTTADTIAVGLGMIWGSGYVDNGSAVRDVRLYSQALTAAQVAAIGY
jgi:hypothetical protein